VAVEIERNPDLRVSKPFAGHLRMHARRSRVR
jgi:hypothetical protein